jgi:hypothetical protein
MEKQFRHETPYGIVSETYDTDEKVIRDFTFYSNGKHDLLTVSQVAEIIEAVDDDIAEHYDQGKEPCNLAIELMRLQTQLFIHRGY